MVVDLSIFEKSDLKLIGLTRISSLDLAVKRLPWGTYGLPPKQPVIWVLLNDCSTAHLRNILKTQYHISKSYRIVINEILYRRQQAEEEMFSYKK